MKGVYMTYTEQLKQLLNRLKTLIIEILNLEETPEITLVDIHNYLLEYTRLERSTQGDTFGYYLTGIAKMIRYLTAGIDVNSEDTQSLDSIISMLEDFLNKPESTDVT
jgi:hypothetical protein